MLALLDKLFSFTPVKLGSVIVIVALALTTLGCYWYADHQTDKLVALQHDYTLLKQNQEQLYQAYTTLQHSYDTLRQDSTQLQSTLEKCYQSKTDLQNNLDAVDRIMQAIPVVEEETHAAPTPSATPTVTDTQNRQGLELLNTQLNRLR